MPQFMDVQNMPGRIGVYGAGVLTLTLKHLTDSKKQGKQMFGTLFAYSTVIVGFLLTCEY